MSIVLDKVLHTAGDPVVHCVQADIATQLQQDKGIKEAQLAGYILQSPPVDGDLAVAMNSRAQYLQQHNALTTLLQAALTMLI